MLVCVREVDKSELAKRLRKRITTPHFERYYSLYATETSATLVDVVDSRARKTFNYDVRITSPLELQEQVVEPLLMTVLAPDRASQAVVVIDGQAGNRFHTLMDATDGVLANTARAAAAQPDVASLSFSAVTLEDNNTLTDILLPDQSQSGEEVTILEDTQEQFTAIEDAHYVALESESNWQAVLQRVTGAFAQYKHQIFSFIFSFHPSTGRPNTTAQFVSFTVNEVARGMKSSRHAVSSAAGLIECNSPTLTFTSTKLLYLLKPSLLGQQPGAWVACFAPVSVLEAAERETFQEAFAVAQTASRLYSSRIALLNAPPAVLPSKTARVTALETAAAVAARPSSPQPKSRGTPPPAEDGGAEYAVDDRRPTAFASASRPTVVRVAQQAQTDASYAQDDSADVSAVRPPTSNLVETPVSVSKGRPGVGMSTPAQPSQAPPPLQPIDTAEKQCSAGVAAAVQTDMARLPASSSAYPRESIQRGSSEEQSAVRYEFDTYRAVMERAMAKLRADMRDYVKQLEETKEEMRAQRKQSRELRRELEAMSESQHATALENTELRHELAHQQQLYERTVQELSQLSSVNSLAQQHPPPPPRQPSPLPSPSPSAQLARRETGEATQALRDDVELLEVRVSELTELVAFHQSEIKDHVSKESSYRQRILELEAALREKEREVISSRAAAQETSRVAADAAVQRAPSSAPFASNSAVAEGPHSRTSSAVLREDMHDVEDRAAEVELHLRTTLDELQRERTQRRQLEDLLKRRETEEVARTTMQTTEAAVHDLQRTFEHQLRELRAEMTGFRSQLAQQVARPAATSPVPPPPPSQVQPSPPAPPAAAPPQTRLTISHESSMRASTPRASTRMMEDQQQQQQQPTPRPPTPQHVSVVQEEAATVSAGNAARGSKAETSGLRSPRSSTRPSVSTLSRRTQSFEEYMQEEPHYELHRASFLRPRSRPTA